MASNALPVVGESQARNAQEGEAPKMLLIADQCNNLSRSSFENTWGLNHYSVWPYRNTCVSPTQSGNIFMRISMHKNKFNVLPGIKACHHQFETVND